MVTRWMLPYPRVVGNGAKVMVDSGLRSYHGMDIEGE